MKKIKSDGGSTPDLYGVPEGCTDCVDIGEAKQMGPLRFGIFKAAWRWADKDGSDLIYNLKKIIFSAGRELERHGYAVHIQVVKKNSRKL